MVPLGEQKIEAGGSIVINMKLARALHSLIAGLAGLPRQFSARHKSYPATLAEGPVFALQGSAVRPGLLGFFSHWLPES